MKIAIVAPRADLVDFSNTNYNLTLAPLYEDPKFYQHWKESKRYKILDNGAAEGNLMDPDDLVQLAIDTHQHEVVAPDVLGKSAETLTMTRRFLTTYHGQLTKNHIRIMAVPQGKTFEQFRDCLWEMVNDPRISVIGLNKRMDLLPPYNLRLAWLYALKHILSPAMFKHKQFHLLGASRVLGEPYFVSRDLQWIRGLDTTYPITAGANKINFDSVWQERSDKLKDIPETLTSAQRHQIRYNIQQMLLWGNSGGFQL
jgi:hypothetical protein